MLATTSVAASGRDPFVSPKGRVTLQALHDRIQVLYQAAYGSSGE
jgi:hypothetical protein